LLSRRNSVVRCSSRNRSKQDVAGSPLRCPTSASFIRVLLCCGLRYSFRVGNMSALSQPPAKRNVLARDLVECDHQIVRRNPGRCDHTVIQGFQQSQPLLLGTAGYKGDFRQDGIIRVGEPEKRWRVPELSSRQDVKYLEEVVRQAHSSALAGPLLITCRGECRRSVLPEYETWRSACCISFEVEPAQFPGRHRCRA